MDGVLTGHSRKRSSERPALLCSQWSEGHAVQVDASGRRLCRSYNGAFLPL